MGSEVKRAYRTLRECTSTGSVSYGIVQPGKHVEDGVPIIRVNNINDGTLDLTDPLKVDPAIDEKHRKTKLEGGEVLLSLVGTTGQCVVAGPELKGWNVARAIAVIKPAEGIDADWLTICLKSPETQHYLDSRANTTVQKTLNLSDVREIPILTVPDDEERYILEWWNTLNDKIELNRRMNATLEGMAQALFKSWFVDFDPVIDNALAAGNPIPDELAPRAEVRRQALANGTANREAAKPFPAAFQETESMGWIPEGWESGKLSDLLEVKYGKDHKKLNEGSIPVYGSGGLMRHADKSLYSGESVLIPRKGTLSNILYLNEEFWTVDTMFYTIPKHEHAPKYAFYHLRGLDFASMNVGSAVPSMTTKVLNELPIVMPDEISLKYFDEVLASYFDKSEASNKQSQALTKLRDTLLPKLISGELRIPEAEQLTEEALT